MILSVSKNLLSVVGMLKLVGIESLSVAQKALPIDIDLRAVGKGFMFAQNKERNLNLSLRIVDKEPLLLVETFINTIESFK